MAINLTVAATIVDIRYDTPRATDAFLIDSNVWYWLSYTRSSQAIRPPQAYQTGYYPNYVKAALKAKAALYLNGLSFSEVAHLIEKNEREIFEITTKTTVSAKEYRHNYPSQRISVVDEIELAQQQMEQYTSNYLNVTVDAAMVKKALAQLRNMQIDIYDYFLVEVMKQVGITQIISDDGDFATVPDLIVFTANETAIKAAAAQGKLLRR
jgi:predicted nucleic acid-binding protein